MNPKKNINPSLAQKYKKMKKIWKFMKNRIWTRLDCSHCSCTAWPTPLALKAALSSGHYINRRFGHGWSPKTSIFGLRAVSAAPSSSYACIVFVLPYSFSSELRLMNRWCSHTPIKMYSILSTLHFIIPSPFS